MINDDNEFEIIIIQDNFFIIDDFQIQYEFIPFNLAYALIKTIIFAFIITSVCAFFGYMTKGGALEVGQASTKVVVYTSILIIISNYLITNLLLS